MSGLKSRLNDITLIKEILLTDSIDVNIVGGGGDGGVAIKGSYNNIANNITLNASAESVDFAINNEWGNESVISYQDSTVAATSFISIYGSIETAAQNWFYIGVLQPAVIRAGVRQASAVLKLKGLKWIRIRNEGTQVANVSCTLFSG